MTPEEVEIDPEDIQIDTEVLRDVNCKQMFAPDRRTTIRHLSTGIQVSVDCGHGPNMAFRSQHKGRDLAMRMLRLGLAEMGYVKKGDK